MKTLKALTVAFSILLIAGLYSCNETGTVDNTVADEYAAPEFFTDGLNVPEPEVQECDFQNEMMLMNEADFVGPRDDRHPRFGRGERDHRPPRFLHFGPIFREMQLTTEQLQTVRGFMQSHEDCIRAARQLFMLSIREIMQTANTQRTAVITAYRNGTITREQASEQLQAINQTVRQAMENNPAKDLLKADMKDCLLTLFANIRSILTADQLVIWDAWVADLPIMQE